MRLANLNRSGPRWLMAITSFLVTVTVFLFALSVFRWSDGRAADKTVGVIRAYHAQEVERLKAARDSIAIARIVCIHPDDEPAVFWADSARVAELDSLQREDPLP